MEDELARRQVEAANRAEQIRGGLQQTAVLFAKAIVERDWRVLQYESVGDWAVSEFGPDRFSTERRREIVSLLTKAGLTQRAIAAATGADHSTVARDQARAGGADAPQETVTFDDLLGDPEYQRQMREAGAPIEPLPPATPRQIAARAREAARRRAPVVTAHPPGAGGELDIEPDEMPVPARPWPTAHVHVYDHCACGAIRP